MQVILSLNYILLLFQVVHQQSSLLAPLAVNAVLKVTEEGKEGSVDLHVRIQILCITYPIVVALPH